MLGNEHDKCSRFYRNKRKGRNASLIWAADRIKRKTEFYPEDGACSVKPREKWLENIYEDVMSTDNKHHVLTKANNAIQF